MILLRSGLSSVFKWLSLNLVFLLFLYTGNHPLFVEIKKKNEKKWCCNRIMHRRKFSPPSGWTADKVILSLFLWKKRKSQITNLSHSIGQPSYFEPSTQQTFPFIANVISGLDIACTLGNPIRMSHTVERRYNESLWKEVLGQNKRFSLPQ